MASVLISAFRGQREAASPQAVVRTLGSLVPAAVEGLVRDVQVLAPAPAHDLASVADHAGCGLVVAATFGDALQKGRSDARGSEILVIEAGAMVDRAFLDEFADRLAILDGLDDRFAVALKEAEPGLLGRLWPTFARTVGVLSTRSALEKLKPTSFRELARALRPRQRFRARAAVTA